MTPDDRADLVSLNVLRLLTLDCDVLRLIGNDATQGAYTMGVTLVPDVVLDAFEDTTQGESTSRVVTLNSGRRAIVVEALPRSSATRQDEYTDSAITQRTVHFAEALDHVASVVATHRPATV